MKLLIRLGTKLFRCTCMWLEAETDVSGSGRKLLRERNETLPKLHCCLLTVCFPAPVAPHSLPWGQRRREWWHHSLATLCFHFDFIKCSNTRFFVSLWVLRWVPQHGIRAAPGCASGSRFQHFRLMVISSYISAALFVLKKAGKRLPLRARQSLEAQEAEDPPSFYTCRKESIKTLPAGMSARGLGFSVQLWLGL